MRAGVLDNSFCAIPRERTFLPPTPSLRLSPFTPPHPLCALCPLPKVIRPAVMWSGWSGCGPGEKFHPDRVLLNAYHKLSGVVRVVRVKVNISRTHAHAHAHARALNFLFYLPLYKKDPDHPDQSSVMQTRTEQNPVRVDQFHTDRTRTARTKTKGD